jgi:5-methylcytosine-specific restriction endonuclease McrA
MSRPIHRRRTYRALLRDPRWQRRRLAVFTRDRWTCQACGATTKELQVHHRWYVPDKPPWEIPMSALVTLCRDCHIHQRR